MGLNATVIPVCRFTSAAPVVDIVDPAEASDPARAGPAIGDAAVGYHCSQGTAPTFSVAATAVVACPSCPGAPNLATAISLTGSGTGQGMGAARAGTLRVSRRIASSSHAQALPGAYAGPVTVVVAP